MDGIVNELADEYAGSAHVVKVDVGRVHGVIEAYGIRSTPTFVLLARSQSRRESRQEERSSPQEEPVLAMNCHGPVAPAELTASTLVITSYSIHYTKLYESSACCRAS